MVPYKDSLTDNTDRYVPVKYQWHVTGAFPLVGIHLNTAHFSHYVIKHGIGA